MREVADSNKYDFDFRPNSYFRIENWTHEVLSRIKGEARRIAFTSFIQENNIETYEDFVNTAIDGEIPPIFYRGLTLPERDSLGQYHPLLMGGEYLPDLESTEVEVARASLRSVTADVISVRTRLVDGLLHYSVIDEYESEFVYKPQTSDEPLTMRQMIDLIDSVDHALEDFPHTGLSRIYRGSELGEWESDQEALNFVTISSDFYPQLESYYEDDAKLWLAELKEPQWEELLVTMGPNAHDEASTQLLELEDLNATWDRYSLGERFDFIRDVAMACSNFRLRQDFEECNDTNGPIDGRRGERLVLECNEAGGGFCLRDELTNFLWKKRREIRNSFKLSISQGVECRYGSKCEIAKKSAGERRRRKNISRFQRSRFGYTYRS